MAIKVQCPSCKTIFSAQESYRGKTIRCPNCRKKLRIAKDGLAYEDKGPHILRRVAEHFKQAFQEAKKDTVAQCARLAAEGQEQEREVIFDDATFGKIAIQRGIITEKHLKEELKLQKQLEEGFGEHYNIGNTLYMKGLITREQINQILLEHIPTPIDQEGIWCTIKSLLCYQGIADWATDYIIKTFKRTRPTLTPFELLDHVTKIIENFDRKEASACAGEDVEFTEEEIMLYLATRKLPPDEAWLIGEEVTEIDGRSRLVVSTTDERWVEDTLLKFKDVQEAKANCPPPDQCTKCGENAWSFISLSPGRKSATYKCKYCKKRVVVRADEHRRQTSTDKRASIPKAVQREVWRRDKGRCVECGSKDNLEFDHIIPVSKGGSNTARNIQLLCQACNRKKKNKDPGNW